MTPEPYAIVAEADLERELIMVRSAAAGGPAGIFGPDSVIWRIDREAAVFLGAARALLLQLAHPWVAAAIAQHSRSLTDPIGRFQRTFSIAYTMVFGTTAQALAAARRMHRRHTAISGNMGENVGALAASLLPPRLRDAFELPYGHSELRSVERMLTAIRHVHPWVPARLRYVAPYHEALARLAGRDRPAPLTRVLNRLWIGRSSMAIGGD